MFLKRVSIFMKCPTLFSGKKKKNTIYLLSAEFVESGERKLFLKNLGFRAAELITEMCAPSTHKFQDKLAPANSADPDQMSQNTASDQDLHCLPLIKLIKTH